MSRPPPPRSSPKVVPPPTSSPTVPPIAKPTSPSSSSPSAGAVSPVPNANELPLSLAISLRGLQYSNAVDSTNSSYIFVSAAVLDMSNNKFEQGRTEAIPINMLSSDIDFRLMIPFMRLVGKKQVLIFDILSISYDILAENIPNIQHMDKATGVLVPRTILPSTCTVLASWTASMKLFFSNASSGCRGFPPIFERMNLADENANTIFDRSPSIIVTGIPSSGLGGTLRPLVGGADDFGKLKLLFRVLNIPSRDPKIAPENPNPNPFFVIQRQYHDNNKEIQWEPAWVSSPLRNTNEGDLPEITVPIISLLHPK